MSGMRNKKRSFSNNQTAIKADVAANDPVLIERRATDKRIASLEALNTELDNELYDLQEALFEADERVLGLHKRIKSLRVDLCIAVAVAIASSIAHLLR
jgi:hypothetical protein